MKLADFGIAKAVGKTREVGHRRHQGQVRVHVARAVAGRGRSTRARTCSRSGTVLYLLITGRKPFDGRDRPGRPDAGAHARAPRSPRRWCGPEPRRRAVHRARPARRPREALAERRADGRPDRRHPRQARAAERAGAAQALARDAERARRRQAARRRRAARERPSIAVDLGSLDLELQEVAPTNVEADRGTGVDTQPLRTAHPRRGHGEQRAHACAPGPAPPSPSGVRFMRWARRMTISAALIIVALGGGFYFARPHLPGLGHAADRQPAATPARAARIGPGPALAAPARERGSAAT